MPSASARVSKTEFPCHRDHLRAGETPVLDSFINLGTAALACIVGVILLLTRVLKQSTLLQLPASGRLLVVRDTIRLDARRQLHLVEYGRREVLLLTGGESDVVVGWFERPATP